MEGVDYIYKISAQSASIKFTITGKVIIREIFKKSKYYTKKIEWKQHKA